MSNHRPGHPAGAVLFFVSQRTVLRHNPAMPDAPRSAPSHLPPSDSRRLGHEVVDFIAEYWQSLHSPSGAIKDAA